MSNLKQVFEQIIKDNVDYDVQNFKIAKVIFFNEENRKPNMNDTKDMNLVASIEVGVRYSKIYL